MTSLNIGRTLSLYQAGSERAMQSRRLEMGRLQEQMSTGLRVNRASDDPTAFAQARGYDALLDRYAQYQRSIDASQSWIDHTQNALDGLADKLTNVYERGMRADGMILDQGEREAEAIRIEQMMVEIVDTLNQRDGDEYIFAGTQTTSTPFTLAGTTVTYNGNTGNRTRQIGDGVQLAINISGDRVLDTGEGFTIAEAVQSIADAVRSGDSAEVGTAIDRIITARDHVLHLGSEAGGIANRLDHAYDQLQQAGYLAEGRRSQVQDTDIAAAVLSFQEQQTGLQAALKVTASVLQTSLLDYLR